MEASLGDMLVKVAMFILVQALVYLILSNSSNLFSKTTKRSHSFKPARSVSIRRILAALADLPPEGETSPSSDSSKSPNSPILEKST
ncbi:Transcription termination factor like [Quillaja saponaria]|uniref:Transcription termination factor like n=1 Tax=Quillaja saponaria TaxID=32244 RepID=A0AAD7PBV4_QUISA|nr:Transcription termination factor like [Quillaja saponaria]